jgi:predicted phage baseplate assembly protein
MSLVAPNLDDRKFQDIVDEAKRRIPRYCPEWTDHNVSDPGVTLIELFAWMTEMLIYRLNRVPERNYIKFLQLMGVRLLAPRPARSDVTFRLSAPQPETVVIPRNTEVATERTSSQEAISFMTERDLRIVVPRLAYCLVSRGDTAFHDFMPALRNPELDLPIFQDVPRENDAMYLGYLENLAGLTLALTIRCHIEGIGVDPRNPPLAWESWNGSEGRWEALALESDTTGGINRDGQVILHVPYGCAPRAVDGRESCWIRCRAVQPKQGQPGYSASPHVQGVHSECIGGTVPASHGTLIRREALGRSEGVPGQAFYLQLPPVLPRAEGETVEVEIEDGDGFEEWSEVEDFGASGAADRHYTLDSVSGELRFGPSIRQPNGQIRQYGQVPPKGCQIRFSAYRSGGGAAGNVGEGTIRVLKDSVPYVQWVRNPSGAAGGRDAEDLEAAKMRGPTVLRSRHRAVTAEDFEHLTREASSGVARVRCLVPAALGEASSVRPGSVALQVVPAVTDPGGPIAPSDLALTDRLRQEIRGYLDERRLLTVEVAVGPPPYRWVAVEARLKAKRRSDPRRIQLEAERKLYQFVNPVSGGPDGDGWPFGRDLYASELSSLLQQVAGVEHVAELQLFVADPDSGNRDGPSQLVTPPPDGLICSFRHRVAVE